MHFTLLGHLKASCILDYLIPDNYIRNSVLNLFLSAFGKNTITGAITTSTTFKEERFLKYHSF